MTAAEYGAPTVACAKVATGVNAIVPVPTVAAVKLSAVESALLRLIMSGAVNE
jgi:hypothetical protein